MCEGADSASSSTSTCDLAPRAPPRPTASSSTLTLRRRPCREQRCLRRWWCKLRERAWGIELRIFRPQLWRPKLHNLQPWACSSLTWSSGSGTACSRPPLHLEMNEFGYFPCRDGRGCRGEMVPCALCSSKKRYGGPIFYVVLSLHLMSGLVFLQSYLKGLHIHGFRLSNFECTGRISELFDMRLNEIEYEERVHVDP